MSTLHRRELKTLKQRETSNLSLWQIKHLTLVSKREDCLCHNTFLSFTSGSNAIFVKAVKLASVSRYPVKKALLERSITENKPQSQKKKLLT